MEDAIGIKCRLKRELRESKDEYDEIQSTNVQQAIAFECGENTTRALASLGDDAGDENKSRALPSLGDAEKHRRSIFGSIKKHQDTLEEAHNRIEVLKGEYENFRSNREGVEGQNQRLSQTCLSDAITFWRFNFCASTMMVGNVVSRL